MPQGKTPADFVNPLIGTDDMGHTFPGAATPFGLVQLSPETDTLLYSYGEGYNPGVYRYCAGYQYKDNSIVGFSHTHFNGTGHSDLGDFLIMPTVGTIHLNPGTADHPEGGYRSRFSHAREEASPGYYAVFLEDYQIEAELTATQRVGFHKYSFPRTDQAHIILDLSSGIYNYDGKVVWASLRVENDTLITGYRQTNGWARARFVYFAMAFSRPIESYSLHNEEKLTYKGFWRQWDEDDNFPERAGHKIKAVFNFNTERDSLVQIKMALSGVSTGGAIANLQKEAPGWDFDRVRLRTKKRWNKELSKIVIKSTPDVMTNFYTSMYHAFLSPAVFSDVNGDYRGLDGNIYNSGKGENYTIFSLWDTFRALHPLFTILQPGRTTDMINSMLAHYQQSVHHILPVWSHYGNENWCMTGYHAVPVIADAYVKGIGGFDADLALAACVSSANYGPYDGIADYKKYGYVPDESTPYSASITLEYAYDDWSLASMAQKMGNKEVATTFFKRANSYRNLFDSKTGFMRSKKKDGSWRQGFDPLSTDGQGYIEGNAWTYSLFAPQDITGLIGLMGGNEAMVRRLDSLFTMEISDESIAHSEDITRAGLVGNYVHGNEPGHHIPYIYVYAGQPWKTQQWVRQILKTMYRNRPAGLCGNDDCGQMSAWYIFSALGFYPVAPGSDQYVFGSPVVEGAVIRLENGKTFEIECQNMSDVNKYVDKIFLNGKPYSKSFIRHRDIVNGGKIVFIMSATPSKNRSIKTGDLPYSLHATQ